MLKFLFRDLKLSNLLTNKKSQVFQDSQKGIKYSQKAPPPSPFFFLMGNKEDFCGYWIPFWEYGNLEKLDNNSNEIIIISISDNSNHTKLDNLWF